MPAHFIRAGNSDWNNDRQDRAVGIACPGVLRQIAAQAPSNNGVNTQSHSGSLEALYCFPLESGWIFIQPLNCSRLIDCSLECPSRWIFHAKGIVIYPAGAETNGSMTENKNTVVDSTNQYPLVRRPWGRNDAISQNDKKKKRKKKLSSQWCGE